MRPGRPGATRSGTYLLESGADAGDLLWFADHPCPPDVIGVNYYVTSERWLDHRVDRYPGRARGAPRAPSSSTSSRSASWRRRRRRSPRCSQETWQRYGIPVAVTEAHIDAGREDQLRWLLEIWRAARSGARARRRRSRRHGLVAARLVRLELACSASAAATTSPDRTTSARPMPRPTALAGTDRRARRRTRGRATRCCSGEGWWRRADRFLAQPVVPRAAVTTARRLPAARVRREVAPILISGATRNARPRVRDDLRAAQPRLPRSSTARRWTSPIRPRSPRRSRAGSPGRSSTPAATSASTTPSPTSSAACARTRSARRCSPRHAPRPAIRLAHVLERPGVRRPRRSRPGSRATRRRRSTSTAEQGRRRARRARRAARRRWSCARARSSVPGTAHNFVAHALAALARGEPFRAAADVRISPTYVPDLVHVCLDLLIDGESGIWHLANVGDVSWAELAARAADARRTSTHRRLQPCRERRARRRRRRGRATASSPASAPR